jgi:hypothetical protein
MLQPACGLAHRQERDRESGRTCTALAAHQRRAHGSVGGDSGHACKQPALSRRSPYQCRHQPGTRGRSDLCAGLQRAVVCAGATRGCPAVAFVSNRPGKSVAHPRRRYFDRAGDAGSVARTIVLFGNGSARADRQPRSEQLHVHYRIGIARVAPTCPIHLRTGT